MGLLITEEGHLVYCDGVKLYDIEINCDENKIELKENRSIFSGNKMMITKFYMFNKIESKIYTVENQY